MRQNTWAPIKGLPKVTGCDGAGVVVTAPDGSKVGDKPSSCIPVEAGCSGCFRRVIPQGRTTGGLKEGVLAEVVSAG